MTILESDVNKTSDLSTIQRGSGSSATGDRPLPGTTPTRGRVSHSGVAGEVKVQSPEGSDLASPLGSFRITRQKLIKPIDGLLPSYRIRRFKHYLSEKKGMKINLHGMTFDRGEVDDLYLSIPYVHRWTKEYRNYTLAKFYRLEAWWKCHRPPVTMLTLTTYQDGAHSLKVKGRRVSRDEAFEILKSSWLKLLRVLRYHLGGTFNYTGVFEPHKSGYPHLHVLIFKVIPDALQERIRSLWTDRYGAGSLEHGVEFTFRPVDDIKSIKNYLMKYLAKSFDYVNNRNYLMFNTIIWEKGYRVIVCSQALSHVMTEPKEFRGVYWVDTELENANGDKKELWKKSGDKI